MEIELKEEFFLETTCRTCAENLDKRLFSIFKANEELIDLIKMFDLEIAENDGLPQQICEVCFESWSKLKIFRETCKTSQITLKEKFSKNLSSLSQEEQNDNWMDEEAFIEKFENEIDTSADVTTNSVLEVCDRNDQKYETTEMVKIECPDIEENDKDLIELANSEDKESSFKDKLRLKERIYIEGDLECKVCVKKFDTVRKFKVHLNIHKEYFCKHCGKTCSGRNQLLRHEKTHTESYKCHICQKSLQYASSLKSHLQTHTGIKSYLCDICGKSFARATCLKKHELTHADSRSFECDMCGKRFLTKTVLVKHKQFHCRKNIFKSVKKKNVEKIYNYPYPCPICTKAFRVGTSLTLHMQTHSKDRNHACNMCESRFKRAAHLQRHITAVHLKERRYSCEHCNKTFAEIDGLNRHMTTHTGKKFGCPHCDKSFAYAKDMRIHERIHTGEKRYLCGICLMSFVDSKNLYNHSKTHSEEEIQKDKEMIFKNSEYSIL